MSSPAEIVAEQITFDLEHGLLPEGVDISKLPKKTQSKLAKALAKVKDALGKLKGVTGKLGKFSKALKVSGVAGFAMWAAQEWWDGYQGFEAKKKAQAQLDGLEGEFADKLKEVKARYAEPVDPNDPNSPMEVPAASRREYLAVLDMVEAVFNLRRAALNASMQKIQSDLSDNWLVWIGDKWMEHVAPLLRDEPVSRAPADKTKTALAGYLQDAAGFTADDVYYGIAPEMIGMSAAMTENGFEIAQGVWLDEEGPEVQRAVSLRVMRCETVARNLRGPRDFDAVDTRSDEFWTTLYRTNQHAGVRAECVLASYRNLRPAGLEILTAALKDRDGRIRALALEGIGALVNAPAPVNLGGSVPLGILVEALESEDRWTRLGGLIGLSLVDGHDDKVHVLARSVAFRDEEDEVVVALALALALGTAEADVGASLVGTLFSASPNMSAGLAGFAFAQWARVAPAAAHEYLAVAPTTGDSLALGAAQYTASRAVLCCDTESRSDLVPSGADFDIVL